MKAAIYNPYLDTLGGGERYTISFAKALSELGFNVDLEWKDKNIISVLEKRFGLKCDNINTVDSVSRGDGYDVCFWVSDGSIPALKARKNFLHFQVPFHDVGGRSLINKMKLFRISDIICNSLFTKNVIDKEFGVNSVVLYPPVDVDSFKPKKKQNIILAVGRFSGLLQNKGQEILIDNFKKMYDQGFKEWKLIVAGGAEVGEDNFLSVLREKSGGYPIKIEVGPEFRVLKDYFAAAKIFWAATGVGINENEFPENVEHFGITVVESMAAGCVPVAFNAGGFKESIKDGINGYLWNNEEELRNKTIELTTDHKNLKLLSKNAMNDSKNFSYEVFKENVKKLL